MVVPSVGFSVILGILMDVLDIKVVSDAFPYYQSVAR